MSEQNVDGAAMAQTPARAGARSPYLDRRVWLAGALGFSSGLPLALSGQALQVRLVESGASLETVGFATLLGLPYTIKFLWAPAVDGLAVPGFSAWFGRRRGWLIASQIALFLATLFFAFSDPGASASLFALAALTVAAASATQDVVIDAWRVEALPRPAQAAGMAAYVAAYRVAMMASTAGLFVGVGMLQDMGLAGDAGWTVGLVAMAALGGVGVGAALLAPEPAAAAADEFDVETSDVASSQHETLEAKANADASAPAPARGGPFAALFLALATLVGRPDAFVILAFVVLFKLPDAFAGAMLAPFILALGFDKETYGWAVKVFGLGATLAGGALGGALYARMTSRAALWLALGLQAATNLVFIALQAAGPVTAFLVAAVAIENLAGGAGTVIFVAYLSALCTERAFTATQFALLTALAAVGRTFLSSVSGAAAASIGWAEFFILSAALVAPAAALLWLRPQAFDGQTAPVRPPLLDE